MRKTTNEDGVVMVFTAIAAVVLVAFVGMGIDLWLMVSNAKAWDDILRRAALSALVAYTTDPGGDASKLAAANLRASQVIAANIDRIPGSKFLGDYVGSGMGVSGTVGPADFTTISGTWQQGGPCGGTNWCFTAGPPSGDPALQMTLTPNTPFKSIFIKILGSELQTYSFNREVTVAWVFGDPEVVD